jgi:pyruvate dehydrogenase E2 component (dihydrolipoamide acetyltransferase)
MELKFVDVGEGITEGHIQKWLVKDGDTVNEDQTVVQIETDKAVVNIPAPIKGVIKINAKEDSTVKVGDILAYVGDVNQIPTQPKVSSVPQPQIIQQQAVSSPNPVKASGPEAKEVIVTPSVRKLARDLNIDIEQVIGTGPNGRVLENDVRNFIKQSQVKNTPKFSEILEEQHNEEVERIPMSQTRKAIAKNMENSWTIPRASHMDIADAEPLFEIVSKEKAKVKEELGVKLTFLPYIIKAVIAALKEEQNKNFNASYDHDKQEIIRKNYYNIGLAAESPDGLKVIVIKQADKLQIIEIAKEIERLANKVRDGTITLEEMKDDTFTITNIGSLGGGFLSVPMINYPDVAILAVHMIRDWPVVVDGEIKVKKVLPFTIAFDHRVVDGIEAVKFGNAFMKYLQDPDFLEML